MGVTAPPTLSTKLHCTREAIMISVCTGDLRLLRDCRSVFRKERLLSPIGERSRLISERLDSAGLLPEPPRIAEQEDVVGKRCVTLVSVRIRVPASVDRNRAIERPGIRASLPDQARLDVHRESRPAEPVAPADKVVHGNAFYPRAD